MPQQPCYGSERPPEPNGRPSVPSPAIASDAATQVAPTACPRCRTESYTTLFQSSDRLYGTTDRRFGVIECMHCGLIRLDPAPSPAELKEFYPDSYRWQATPAAGDRLAAGCRRFVLRDHARFVEGAVHGPEPVLDIGCGSGSLLQALQSRDIPVCGGDPSCENAKRVRRSHAVPAVCCGLPDVPFRPGSFSVVTALHVLERLPDPSAALAALRELPAPGGRIVIQAPNADSWQALLLGENWNGFDVPRRLLCFRLEDLEDLLDACGYEIVRRKFFSLRDNPAGLATSLCPRLDPVVRRVRKMEESRFGSLLRDALYFALAAAAAPLTLLEAAAGAGSTVMIEAARRGEA